MLTSDARSPGTPDMPENTSEPVPIYRTYINSFHYLYQDAEYLQHLANKPQLAGKFDPVRLCRTALLLYILSLEGLINRALDHLAPHHIHDFVLDREERFSTEDKWLLLPLLVSDKGTFDKSRYPWSHLAELLRMRNDYVHPKHDRPAYYKAVTAQQWTPLSWNEIPAGLGVGETEIVYRQTRIPRDPYALRAQHIDTVKKVVDDVVNELDKLLDGKIMQNGWLHNDSMELIFPPNAQLKDLPPPPKKGSD